MWNVAYKSSLINWSLMTANSRYVSNFIQPFGTLQTQQALFLPTQTATCTADWLIKGNDLRWSYDRCRNARCGSYAPFHE